MHIQTNQTENTPSASQPGYGGMDQVSSGPAGLLYSLSNQLIRIYNELQDLYGKVANAETSVQEITINTGAASQRDAAYQQAMSITSESIGTFFGAAVTVGTIYAETKGNSEIDTEMTKLDNELAPLKKLDTLEKGIDPTSHVIGNSPPQQPANADITQRAADLKNGNYNDNGNQNPDVINQHAINEMSPEDFAQFKKDLDNKIMDKEKRINTLQSRRQMQQQTINSYGQIVSQASNSVSKGGQAAATSYAGKAQAVHQTASGVQQMAGSTADSSRGSLGQDYAKVTDAIAAARQGAQAYAQT